MSQKFKNIISIFIENYIAGGSDKIARDIIEGLSYKKAYIFVNKDNDTSILFGNGLPSNIEIIYYGITTLPKLGEFANSFEKKNKVLFFCIKLFNLLIRYPLMLWFVIYFYFLFRKYSIDVFFSNNGGYPGGECNRMATVAAFLVGCKNYHIVHNIATKPFLKIVTPFESIIDMVLDRCSKIICVSNQTKEALLSKRLIKQEPLIIYNGVQSQVRGIKQFDLSKNKLKVLNIGALGNRKNQILILDALKILSDKGHANVEFYIVGQEEDDGYLKILQDKVKEDELCVHFEGFRANPYSYYEMCDVFILSSIVESFALVRVEAMSVGMPIITTDVGDAYMQVQNDINGFIVDTPDSMATALEKYILEPHLIKEHAQKGYGIYKTNFTHDKMIEQYQALIDKD